jgi:hypothetical protein
MKLDDENWHASRCRATTAIPARWAMEKAPVYHIVD